MDVNTGSVSSSCRVKIAKGIPFSEKRIELVVFVAVGSRDIVAWGELSNSKTIFLTLQYLTSLFPPQCVPTLVYEVNVRDSRVSLFTDEGAEDEKGCQPAVGDRDSPHQPSPMPRLAFFF